MDHRPTIAESSRDALGLLRAATNDDPLAVFEAVNAMDLLEAQAVLSFLVGALASAVGRLADIAGKTTDDLIDTALARYGC